MGFNFKDLFVLDIANNHQGNLEHGLRIINQHSEVIQKETFVVLNFNLEILRPSCTHKDLQESNIKHILRDLMRQKFPIMTIKNY